VRDPLRCCLAVLFVVCGAYAFGTHVQLMLLTGCRVGEWAHAVSHTQPHLSVHENACECTVVNYQV
jgi:hypothetical protein